MINVNLKTGENEVIKSQANFFGKSLVVPLAALCLVFLLYAALVIIGKSLSSRINEAAERNQTDYSNFLAGNGNAVIDFKNRSQTANEAMSNSRPSGEILSQIESSILPAVYLNSFQYDNTKKIISLKCVGDNFNTVAKQILSFKESGYYMAVVPGDGAFEKDGKLNFSIDLTLK